MYYELRMCTAYKYHGSHVPPRSCASTAVVPRVYAKVQWVLGYWAQRWVCARRHPVGLASIPSPKFQKNQLANDDKLFWEGSVQK